MRPIDADALLESIEELKKLPWYNGENGNFERLVRNDAIGTIEDLCVKEAPTLDYAPVRRGEWVHDINNLYGCSECLERETMSRKKLKKFCPNCGAKMDGGENDV